MENYWLLPISRKVSRCTLFASFGQHPQTVARSGRGQQNVAVHADASSHRSFNFGLLGDPDASEGVELTHKIIAFASLKLANIEPLETSHHMIALRVIQNESLSPWKDADNRAAKGFSQTKQAEDTRR